MAESGSNAAGAGAAATSAAPLITKEGAKELFNAAETAFEGAAARRRAYPKIEASFRLGWHMAELFLLAQQAPHVGDAEPAAAVLPATLPSAGDLDAPLHRRLLLRQIEVDRKEIETAAGLPQGALPAAARLDDTSRARGPAAIVRDHTLVLEKLTATDFRLGKAYSLGIALADLALRSDASTEPDALKEAFAPGRIGAVSGSLTGLTHCFAAGASAAVVSTLKCWQECIRAQDKPLTQAQVDKLREQGRIWRGLLSGETPPRELLSLDDYVDVAEGVAKAAVGGVRKFAKHMWVELVAGALLFAGVAGALVYFTHGDARGLVGAATILGALGISWKSIGTALGKSLERIEGDLVDAEVSRTLGIRALKQP